MDDRSFSKWQDTVSIDRRGNLPAGEFQQMFFGEYTSGLLWKPNRGRARRVYISSVLAMVRSGTGAIAVVPESSRLLLDGEDPLLVTRLSEAGFALKLTRDRAGTWQLKEIARFTGDPAALTSIGPDTFAALSGGRTIIFSSDQILGLATCVGP